MGEMKVERVSVHLSNQIKLKLINSKSRPYVRNGGKKVRKQEKEEKTGAGTKEQRAPTLGLFDETVFNPFDQPVRPSNLL